MAKIIETYIADDIATYNIILFIILKSIHQRNVRKYQFGITIFTSWSVFYNIEKFSCNIHLTICLNLFQVFCLWHITDKNTLRNYFIINSKCSTEIYFSLFYCILEVNDFIFFLTHKWPTEVLSSGVHPNNKDTHLNLFWKIFGKMSASQVFH